MGPQAVSAPEDLVSGADSAQVNVQEVRTLDVGGPISLSNKGANSPHSVALARGLQCWFHGLPQEAGCSSFRPRRLINLTILLPAPGRRSYIR